MLTATGKLTLRLDDVVDYVHDNFVGLLHVSGEQLRFVLLPRRNRLNGRYQMFTYFSPPMVSVRQLRKMVARSLSLATSLKTGST